MHHQKMTEWKMIALEKGGILLDWKMVKMYCQKMTEWKMIASKKDGIVQDQKMAENASM